MQLRKTNLKAMRYIQATSRSEIKLFSEVENWVSQHNPIRLIDLIVEKTVCSNPDNFIWKWEANIGRKSYSPATMLKLLLYGYLNKIRIDSDFLNNTKKGLETSVKFGERVGTGGKILR